MKIKHFEYIVIYLSVFLVCVLMAVFGRIYLIEKGADDYTANVVFWVFIGLGVVLFAILSLFLDQVINWVLKIFFKKGNQELLESEKQNNDIEKLREEKEIFNKTEKQQKIEKAILYTQKQFASFTTNENLKQLCENINVYGENLDFENLRSITVKNLSSLDLYHFGWNIWNHFRINKQESIAQFLKKTFEESLKEVDVKSIKTHLKDDEKKGNIKIIEDISDY